MTGGAGGAGGGLRIGRVLGVPVVVSPSWLLFGGLIVATYGPALTPTYGQTRAYAAAASFALLLLLSVLLHELGHCAVARAFGLPVRRITVTFLAGLTEITEPPQTPAREYAVAVSGPMVSLLLSAAGAGLTPLFEQGSLPYLLALGTAATNGVVAAFNLLPGLPLDGGRVLRAAVWRLTGDADRSTVVAAAAGRVVALVAVPLAVLVLLPAAGFGDPSLLTAVLAALVAAFVFAGASTSLAQARVVQRLPAGVVDRLARPALAVSDDLPVAEVVRRAQEAQRHAVVVVDAAGRITGVVDEDAVRALPQHRQPWVAVSTVSRSTDPATALDPRLSGTQLLEALQRSPSPAHLVAGAEPRVLVTADVARAVAPSRRR